MDMYDRMARHILPACCGIALIAIVLAAILSPSKPDSNIINKHMQELSKSCIEEHNGTFRAKFIVGDTNQIEYECIIGGR